MLRHVHDCHIVFVSSLNYIPEPIDHPPALLGPPSDSESARCTLFSGPTMEDTRARWERAFVEAVDFDTWGQVRGSLYCYFAGLGLLRAKLRVPSAPRYLPGA